jgi:DNA-binding transcriptional LysR family regulator
MIDDIRYLIVFAKIVEAGSISGGAEALGLTTATASTHLAKLEKIWVVLCYIEIPGNSL